MCVCGCGLYGIRPWAEWRGKTSPEGNGGDESSGQEPWAQASVHVSRQGQQSPEGCSRGLDEGGRSIAAGPGDVVSMGGEGEGSSGSIPGLYESPSLFRQVPAGSCSVAQGLLSIYFGSNKLPPSLGR